MRRAHIFEDAWSSAETSWRFNDEGSILGLAFVIYSNIAIMLPMNPGRARPKLIDALRDYDRGKAVADLVAGVTVGLVALPLALAFAISSGLTPQAGIYTAVVAGAIISALGGSRVQIGGATGAFVVILGGLVAPPRGGGPFLLTPMAWG